MGQEKYVAYVSTYTIGDQGEFGITVFDVDMEKGRFYEKEKIKITNSSYVSISHHKKYLYSITDFGVESYRIKPDGGLENINLGSVNGMRGRHVMTDYEDKFLFVSGYHDGKLTVLRTNEDGSVGEITEEIYYKGLGIVAERNVRPHVSCARMSRDNRYLCVADSGMDHTNVYRLDHSTGKLKLVDVIRSDMGSGPEQLKFSIDGRYLYIVHEVGNCIDVYSYTQKDGNPFFEKIQSISTLNNYHATGSIASALNFSDDFRYLVSSNAGDNSAAIFEVDQETGLLTRLLCLPVSGEYPKDVALFPDNRHLVSLNQDSGTLTFFTTDMQHGLLVMNGPELRVPQPNCVIFHKLSE